VESRLERGPNNKHSSGRLAVSGSAEATPEVRDVVTPHVSRGQWTDTSTTRGLTQESQRQPLDAQWVISVDDEPQTDGADPSLRFGQEMSLATQAGLGFGFAPTDMRQEWFNGDGTHFPAVCETGGDGTVNPQHLMVSGPSAAEGGWSGGPWNDYHPGAPHQATPDDLSQGGFGFCETEFTARFNPPALYPADFNAYCPASASIPGAPVSSVAFSDVSHVLDI
jgi:hypothetical protein